MLLDGKSVGHNEAIAVKAGQVLTIRATFGRGRFGCHATGALKAGDTLRLAKARQGAAKPAGRTSTWSVGVVYGPHGAPDFFLDEDITTLFATDYGGLQGGPAGSLRRRAVALEGTEAGQFFRHRRTGSDGERYPSRLLRGSKAPFPAMSGKCSLSGARPS